MVQIYAEILFLLKNSMNLVSTVEVCQNSFNWTLTSKCSSCL